MSFSEVCAGVLPCLASAPPPCGQAALTVFVYFLAFVVAHGVIFALIGEVLFRYLSLCVVPGDAATRPGGLGVTFSHALRVFAESRFLRRALFKFGAQPFALTSSIR